MHANVDEVEARSMRSGGGASGQSNNSSGRRKKKGGRNTTSNNSHGGAFSNNLQTDLDDMNEAARAFAAAWKSQTGGSGGKSIDTRFCTYCENTGHLADQCHFNPENPSERLLISTDSTGMGGVSDGSASNGDRSSKSENSSGQTKPKSRRNVDFACMSVKKNAFSSYIDSGATIQVFHDRSAFVPRSLKPCTSRTISLADESCVSSTHVGKVTIPLQNANLCIQEAYLVPDLGFNLVSVGRLPDAGVRSIFDKQHVKLVETITELCL